MMASNGQGCVFHLAFTVTDLDATRRFYTNVIGCDEGSIGDDWCIFDFFGHKITATLDPARAGARVVHEDPLPLRHFGIFIDTESFHTIAGRLQRDGTKFVIEPQLRGSGTDQEQWIMFTTDPSGNGLEFQSVTYPRSIFWPEEVP